MHHRTLQATQQKLAISVFFQKSINNLNMEHFRQGRRKSSFYIKPGIFVMSIFSIQLHSIIIIFLKSVIKNTQN